MVGRGMNILSEGGEAMAIEQIKLIREAEERAEQIRKKSNQEAKEIISKAQGQAAHLLEEANRQLEKNYKEAMEKAQEDAEQSYRDIIEKAKREIESQIASADKYKNDAVSIIIGKVVN